MTIAEEIQSATRFAKIAELIKGTVIEEKNYSIPEVPGRYLVIEKSSDEWIWATSCETLDECARDISQSDTDREEVVIYDLDSSAFEEARYVELLPILEVSSILGDVEPWYSKLDDTKLRALLKSRFLWLGTGENVNAGEVIDSLNLWWNDLTDKG